MYCHKFIWDYHNTSIWEVVTVKNIRLCTFDLYMVNYSLFTFSCLRFESGGLRNGGMLILRIYFAVDGMSIEMYGESWNAGLLTSDDVMLYITGFGTT